MVKTNHGCAVRIAEDDLCPHVNQLVNKKEPAFKHLLMDEHAAFCLGGNDQHDADQVGG